ncbi:LamG domain-containing protein [candidate division KSB1 bacterium]|nr:LamG domain-containing protein [candidate division KSB1 bacterium]
MKKYLVAMSMIIFIASVYPNENAQTLHLAYEAEADILCDFLSSANIYRVAAPGQILENQLARRQLELDEGKFGKCLHIKHGWSVTRGTDNESGIDLDLIVATMWGDWRTKPHYWGAGKFHGDRGTIAFWVKDKTLNPGLVFIQSAISWGRKERDLLRIDLDEEGKLSASIRDIYYQYHKIESENSVWLNGQWQHIAVVYDRAYGLKLYHNGKMIASNWGKDAWWQTPLPGLFSPFLPESWYDEMYFFDRALDQDAIAALYKFNSYPDKPAEIPTLDESARNRLLTAFCNFENTELPEFTAGESHLSLKQTPVADCHDEKIPAWWVMDGRYELAWPHPYLLFTFILGDVDFHGDKVDINLEKGALANYISFEGILDGIEVFGMKNGEYDSTKKILDMSGYPSRFSSKKLNLGEYNGLHIPLVSGYGTPTGLVDRGSLKFPLSGKMRLHEVQLWQVQTLSENGEFDCTWRLAPDAGLDARYNDALLKLKSCTDRTIFVQSAGNRGRSVVPLEPLQAFHFFGPDLIPDAAIDRIKIAFYVVPEKKSDVLWLKMRDPANPSRIWTQIVLKATFNSTKNPQAIAIEIDPVDLMLAGEDRFWFELMFSHRMKIMNTAEMQPSLAVQFSEDREKSLAEYAVHEMIPARMQYIKEYNYQPWLFTGEQREERNWSNFGGPYDMWYPPEAVLRHDPGNEIALIYKRLTGERGLIYGGGHRATFSMVEKFDLTPNIPTDAPAWAIWQREMYKKQLRTIHWIASMQREDGFLWGGSNDDVFVPLGYAGIPLMGDDVSRNAFLKMYDGLEKLGVYKNGYCDIWPIDYLHITDFLASRGLMVPYALGDPHVIEREMITAKVYSEIMAENNAVRAAKGLPVFELTPESRKTNPKLWGENLVRDYELTQVQWYWGKTPASQIHSIADRKDIARKMMTIARKYDKTEEFDWTRSMRHTDRQGGAPGRNELIHTALGGRLQGRIEPHPHSMVVSWDNPDPDIARLVSYGDSQTVKINLYNFKSKPQALQMRLWRIVKGDYQLTIGRDNNDDGEIDTETNLLRNESIPLRRFETVRLTVPSNENIAMILKCTQQHEQPQALPDLALNAHRDIRFERGKLYVTLHNIGNADARDVDIEILTRTGEVIALKSISEMAAPTDLVPKMVEMVFDLNGKSWHRIVIDPSNSIEEIFEENNSVLNRGESK